MLLGAGDWPPLYDYYQWLFQGHIMAGLLFGAGADSGSMGELYGLHPAPVPNLAAPFTIAVLDTVLPIEIAGRVFLALGVLGFTASYAYLVRSVQQRRSAIEFSGFFWVFGFFLYKGYLSYLFGLPLAFVVIGVLHRRVVHGRARLSGGALLGVAVLQTLLYLSHLLAWSVALLATVAYGLTLARRRSWREAARLGSTVLPATVLCAWYVVAERGGTGFEYYDSWRNKGRSLVEPTLPFLTLEPFPPPFSPFAANALCLAGLAAAIFVNVDWRGVRGGHFSRPVVWLAAALAAGALLMPFLAVNDMRRPDGRWVLPAVLLLLAALPLRPARLVRTLPVVLVAAVGMALHAAVYTSIAPQIEAFHRAGERVIPRGSPVLYISVHPQSCTGSSGPSSEVPVLKWFGVVRAMEMGPLQVNIDETSIVFSRFDDGRAEGLTVVASDLREIERRTLPSAADYPYVELLGCQEDLSAVRARLGPDFEPAAVGQGFMILRAGEP